MDEQLLIRLAQIAIRCVVAYYVYKDAIKHEVPNKNFWVAATFIFWPVVVVYLFYRQRAARTVDLSFEQKAQLEIDHKREEEKRRIAAERAEMEIERKNELEKNQISEEELEKLRQERKAAKAKRMKELEEERAEQERQHAELRSCRKPWQRISATWTSSRIYFKTGAALTGVAFSFCARGAVEFFFVSSC